MAGCHPHWATGGCGNSDIKISFIPGNAIIMGAISLKRQYTNLRISFSRASRFSLREAIQHSEWNTGGIWPPHYPKYSKNRSLTKMEKKKFFDFFSFFFGKNRKFLACFYKGNFFFENRRKNRVENFGFQKNSKIVTSYHS